MLLLSQAPNGALSARRCPSAALNPSSSATLTNPLLFSKSRSRLPSHRHTRKPPPGLSLGPSGRPLALPVRSDETVVVGDEGVPLEGVIKGERPAPPSRLLAWAQVGLLAGGDVLCLLLFSAVGRFSHGFPVLDFETLRTADPFIAGWFLSAYFLGCYGDDGKGKNGSTRAVVAAAKAWGVGIPLGIAIRTATSGHIPPTPFILVSMGSTSILLIGWRALVSGLLSSRQSKGNDAYKRGSPFELFELLMSLVRRW